MRHHSLLIVLFLSFFLASLSLAGPSSSNKGSLPGKSAKQTTVIKKGAVQKQGVTAKKVRTKKAGPLKKGWGKGLPPWQRILWTRLAPLRGDPNMRSLASLAQNPTCWVDPFRDNILLNIGRYSLAGDRQQTTDWMQRWARHLLCINSRGMDRWDQFFAQVHRDCLALSKSKRKQCLRATTVPALMVADFFLHTGYTAVQRHIRQNLGVYQSAYRGQEGDSLFCINHNNGSLLRFDSRGNTPIMRQAVTTVANRNGELGLGLVSVCELAHSGFQGINDRGVQQLLACLGVGEEGGAPIPPPEGALGGAAPPEGALGGATPPEGAPSSPGYFESFMEGAGTGGDAPADPFNGMSESQIRAVACGLGGGGNTASSFGNLNPSSSCLINMITTMRDQQRSQDPTWRMMDCHNRFYGHSLWDQMEPVSGGAGAALDPDCMVSEGSSKDSRRRGVVAYETVREHRFRGHEMRSHVRMQVEGDGAYEMWIDHTQVRDSDGGWHDVDPRELFAHNNPTEPQNVGIGSPHGTPHLSNGNVNTSPGAGAVMDQASREGNVEQCTSDTQSCRDARAAHEERERQRRSQETAAGGGSSGGGASDPGPDGWDNCSAESQRMQAFFDCVEGEGQEGRIVEDPGFGPWINPGDQGGGGETTPAMFAGIDCMIRSGSTAPISNEEGWTDRCMSPDDCFTGGSGEVIPEAKRDPNYGTVDPNPEDEEEDRCREAVEAGQPPPPGCLGIGGEPPGGGGDPMNRQMNRNMRRIPGGAR